MSSRPAAELFTVEDYRAMPPGPPYYQLVEGELIMAPSPNSFHQDIAGNIFTLLRQHVRKLRLGKVCFAPLDVYLSDANVFQPDVLFLANPIAPRFQADGVHGAPDLVVEIVSPSNGPLELRRKRPLYAQHGVKEEWLIEPTLQQIHRYDFTRDRVKPVRILDNDESFETPLLPGLTINAAEVFER
jgi:Uma2 family endonuclease